MDPNVMNLVVWLSNNEADTSEIVNIYNDVMATLATLPILAQFSTIVAPQAGLVSLPANAVRLLLAFYENFQLGELSIREADWLLPGWRTTTGTPYNFVRESLGNLEIQLAPQPTDNGNAQMLSSYTTSALPVWLQLPVALLVLDQEYRRESDHQNVELANASRVLGMFMIGLLTRNAKKWPMDAMNMVNNNGSRTA